MKVIVENENEMNMVKAVCSEACRGGNLNVAKIAVIITDSVEMKPVVTPEKKRKAGKKEQKKGKSNV